jgi:hypothetical protein
MQSISITIGDLHRLIDPVLPCASTDYMLPVLTGVHVKSSGRWLVATATDRFRIGIKRVAAEEGEWPEFEALLPLAGIKSIFSSFKALRGQNPVITLSVEDGKLTATCEGGLAGDLARASCQIFLVDGEYPKVASLLSSMLTAEPLADPQGFNWGYLSSFLAAGDRRDGSTLQIRLVESGSKPAALIVGEDFVGAVMARKPISANFGDLSGWDEIFDGKTAAKTVAA